MNIVISKDGTPIACDISGAGEPLIYITGAICHRKFMPVLDDVKVFSAGFTVISYDRRGRGDSGDTLPYSIDKEIDDIEALIQTVGKKVNLLGHSSGCLLALGAALRMPDKINKVFIYDPANAQDQKAEEDYKLLINQVNTLIAEKNYTKAIRAFVIGIGMPKILAYLLPLMPGWNKMKALAPTLAYDMELTSKPPVLSELAKISVPVKVCFGEKSPDSIKQVSKITSEGIRNSTLTEIPKQDHMVSPKVLLPHLKSFFQ